MKNLILFILITLVAVAGCQKDDPELIQTSHIYYFGLIHNYLDAPTLTAEETQELQSAHLGNIERLYKLGVLPLAGPFGTPNSTDWAGVFFYDVPTKDSANKLAETDPACESGHLYVTNYPLECEGEIKYNEPVEMTSFTSLFIFSDETHPIDFTYDQFLEMIFTPAKTQFDSMRIALSGSVIDQNKENFSALYIIEGITPEELLTVMDNLPTTSRKRWPTKVIQWYGPMGLRLE